MIQDDVSSERKLLKPAGPPNFYFLGVDKFRKTSKNFVWRGFQPFLGLQLINSRAKKKPPEGGLLIVQGGACLIPSNHLTVSVSAICEVLNNTVGNTD